MSSWLCRYVSTTLKSICLIIYHIAFYLNIFIELSGSPPNCKPECNLDIDCPFDLACREQRCSNPCLLNRCGQGAICTVVNHEAKCSCPEGWIGNPQRNGKCGKNRGFSTHYFPISPSSSSSFNSMRESQFLEYGSIGSNGESITPNLFQNHQHSHFPCEPWPCGPNRLVNDLIYFDLIFSIDTSRLKCTNSIFCTREIYIDFQDVF